MISPLTYDDQRIITTVIDLLDRARHRNDVQHAEAVRRHLRAALSTAADLEGARAKALRRARELHRRTAPKPA